MVRAILDGKKTQTRRIIKPQPALSKHKDIWWWGNKMGTHSERGLHEMMCINSPYGRDGGLLWVRENFYKYTGCQPKMMPKIRYMADDPVDVNQMNDFSCWSSGKPSIHMPRRASRIILEIKDIRIERLQDISKEDAIAEGITKVQIKNWNDVYIAGDHPPGLIDLEQPNSADPVGAFQELWESINGQDSWDANPFVWVVTFEPHICNIDEYLKRKEAA